MGSLESFDKFTRQYRLDESGKRKSAIIQAEDELSALGIALGASWNGVRSFTVTSGPGISLMSELLGLAYFAEIPVVLVNVQRAGPSTGMPTRTQQSDTLACAYASHGDTKHVLLFPYSPTECFEMAADSFDLAETLQTPVIIMSDLDLGMNDHVCLPMVWDDHRQYRRGKVLDREQLENLTQDWGRYLDMDGDGICYRTYPGTHPSKGAFFTRGSSHDQYAAYTEDNDTYKRCMQRLSRKWHTAKTLVPGPHIKTNDKTSTIGLIFYGTSTHATYEAVEMLDKKGLALDTMRLRGFPFQNEVRDFIDRHEKLFVIEQNRDGQMRTLLMNELNFVPDKLASITHIDSTPIDARYICQSIEALLEKTLPQGGAA